MALLEIRNVCKSFPARHRFITGGECPAGETGETGEASRLIALDNVNLDLERGCALAIVGESGAGKTTLGNLVVGLLVPDSGTLTVDGLKAEIALDRREWCRRVQLVWQDAAGSLDPRMKLARAIAEPSRVRGEAGSDARDRARRLMDEVGLVRNLESRYPHELSGGQAQRAVIARALAADPKLLVLDEPASALDARIKLRIIELLSRLRRERGVALMVITHDLRLAVRLAEDVAILKDGRIVESGRILDLTKNPRDPFTRELVSSVPRFPERIQSPI